MQSKIISEVIYKEAFTYNERSLFQYKFLESNRFMVI